MNPKTKTPPISMHNMYSPFCEELPESNQGLSLKGGGREDCRALAKSARKA